MTLPSGWVVRLARPSDASGLARVHVESWQRAYQGLVDPEYLAGLDIEERASGWEARLVTSLGADLTLRAWSSGKRAGRTELLIDPEGLVQGFVSYGPRRPVPGVAEDSSQGELYALYVHPDVWGLGGGRALYERCLGALRLAGFQSVTIWTMRGAAQARAFYKRQGAQLTDAEQTQRTQGLEMDLVCYRAEVPARGRATRTLSSALWRGSLVALAALAVGQLSEGPTSTRSWGLPVVVAAASSLEAWRLTRRGPSDLLFTVVALALPLGWVGVSSWLALPLRGPEAMLGLVATAATAGAVLGPLWGEGPRRLAFAHLLCALTPALLWLTEGTSASDLLVAAALGLGGCLLRPLLLQIRPSLPLR